MPMPKEKKRIGGRGCPNCGSHNTEAAGRTGGVHWCVSCRHRWAPCKPMCRGYRLAFDPLPRIQGCPDCRVPDTIAVTWPEAYRAMANELDRSKKLQLAIK